jgi:flagellar basal body rod protein FlgG
MIQALSTALGGLNSSSALVDVAANNVANLGTSGFQASRLVQGPSASGGSFLGTVPNSSSGPIRQTGVSTDLALSGPGYFRIDEGNGNVATTRDGSFVQDAQGYLRSADGGYVLGQSGRIQAPAGSSLSVGRDGTVTATAANGATTQVDTLSLASAPGGPASGTPGTNGLGSVVSGALEGSNTDLVGSMVDMIVGKNSFEANAKVIHVTDEMMKKAYQL